MPIEEEGKVGAENPADPAGSDGGAARVPGPVAPDEIFRTFLRISLHSFGGTNFWSRRVLCEEKRWITEREFAEMLGVAQLIPGPNVYALNVMLGFRLGGYPGVAACIAGYLGPPILVVLLLGVLYSHFGDLPMVQRALTGMSAASAGLIIATGVRLAMALPRGLRTVAFLLLAFACIGLMRLPLVPTLLVLAPLAFFAAWRERGA